MNYFLDNCLPPKWSVVLNALAEGEGYKIVHLREKFKENAKDVDWLKVLGDEGDWVVVSADLRIRRAPQEREAWREAKLTTFLLHERWSDHTLWEKSWRIVQWWPRIVEQAKGVEPGATFVVPPKFRGGKFIQA